jgi:hypothetical protein
MLCVQLRLLSRQEGTRAVAFCTAGARLLGRLLVAAGSIVMMPTASGRHGSLCGRAFARGNVLRVQPAASNQSMDGEQTGHQVGENSVHSESVEANPNHCGDRLAGQLDLRKSRRNRHNRFQRPGRTSDAGSIYRGKPGAHRPFYPYAAARDMAGQTISLARAGSIYCALRLPACMPSGRTMGRVRVLPSIVISNMAGVPGGTTQSSPKVKSSPFVIAKR